MKLTKKNQELVVRIARGFIVTPIIAALSQDGVEVTPELIAGIQAKVSETDISELTKLVGEGLSQTVDFKSLAKVDKFLAEQSTQDVLASVQAVAQAVNPLVVGIAVALLEEASAEQEGDA